jgi:hypothetical protein
MATAGGLCTTIISDLGRGDTSLSDIVLIDIQSAIRDYEAYRFYFNERALSVTLSATDTYALSLFAAAGTGISDIIEVDGIEIAVSSRTYDLTEKTSAELHSRQGNGLTGYPSLYAIFNQSVLIESKPSPAVISTAFCHVKFTEIAAGGFSTTNVWTNDASELIRNAALKRLWGRRFRDYDAAQAAERAEGQALRALQRRTEALAGDRIEGFL